MSDEKIVLVARLKVREDAVEAAKEAALAIVADSRNEEGCLNYDVHQAIDDPTIFIWHETWKNKTAIDEHFQTSFFQAFSEKVGKISAEEPVITLTKMISEQK